MNIYIYNIYVAVNHLSHPPKKSHYSKPPPPSHVVLVEHQLSQLAPNHLWELPRRRPPRSRNVETQAMMSPSHPLATPLPVGNAKMKPENRANLVDFYMNI